MDEVEQTQEEVTSETAAPEEVAAPEAVEEAA